MKTLKGTLVGVVALLCLGATAVPALAAQPTATDLTLEGQWIRPGGGDLPIFGINLTATSLNDLSAVRVDFAQVGDADFDIGDLEASPDGVTLWKDTSRATPETQDVLDPGDKKVSTSYTFSGLRATLNINPPTDIPPATAEQGNYTFFVTVRASGGVGDGDDFTATLPSDAFVATFPFLTFVPVTTHTITADPSAPFVEAFLKAFGQNDNISWRLSEAVTGVGASTVSFREHGSSTEVPATVSWAPGSNSVVIDPAAPLIAGQSYDARLLPDGPGAIRDAAGNELAPDFQTFRAVTDVSETASGSAYKWRALASSSAYGGSYTVNNTTGAAATWTFTGTSVTWYTITDPYQGIANVYIDGKAKPNVNNYSSATKYKVARVFSGLSSGAHSITIRVSGAKGSTAGKDARVAIDAFKVGGLYGTPNVAYRWATVSSSGAQGGSYVSAKFPWTEMTFTFAGTSIEWRTILGPGMGKAAVYIDGVSRGSFDNYSGVTIFKYNRSFTGLSSGVHTIKIMVSSSKNALSKDYTIAVDGFVIG
jgi:hypothetical protein